MLVGMVVRFSGEVTQGLDRFIITAFPAVGKLPVCLMLDGSFGDAKFVSIFNK